MRTLYEEEEREHTHKDLSLVNKRLDSTYKKKYEEMNLNVEGIQSISSSSEKESTPAPE